MLFLKKTACVYRNAQRLFLGQWLTKAKLNSMWQAYWRGNSRNYIYSKRSFGSWIRTKDIPEDHFPLIQEDWLIESTLFWIRQRGSSSQGPSSFLQDYQTPPEGQEGYSFSPPAVHLHSNWYSGAESYYIKYIKVHYLIKNCSRNYIPRSGEEL